MICTYVNAAIIYHLSSCLFLFQDQFHRHLFLEAERRQLRPIIENKSHIVLVHTSSGYKYACSFHFHVLCSYFSRTLQKLCKVI